MCARFYVVSPADAIERLLDVPLPEDPEPRWNIAPIQFAWAGIATAKGPEWRQLRWGLIPRWAKDDSMAARTINARSETAAERPAFRDALRRRRAVVPVTGFYEWRDEPTGTGSLFDEIEASDETVRQPFAFSSPELPVMGLAGLWETWAGAGEPLGTFTILTTEANSFMRGWHDRMPCILRPEDIETWLDPTNQSLERLWPLLAPAPDNALVARRVSRKINRVQYQGADVFD